MEEVQEGYATHNGGDGDGDSGGGGGDRRNGKYGVLFVLIVCVMFVVLVLIVYAIFRLDQDSSKKCCKKRRRSCGDDHMIYTFSSGPIGVGGIFIGTSTGGGLALGMGSSDGAGGVIGIPSIGVNAMLTMARVSTRKGTLDKLHVHLNAGPSDDMPTDVKVAVWTAPCDDHLNWTETSLQVTHTIDSFDSLCLSNTTDTVKLSTNQLFVIWVETTGAIPVQLLAANASVEFH